MARQYDVIIVGGGITGASLLYTLSNYSDVKKVLLLEKYDKIGGLNTSSRNNAQTLHYGDIETNYTLEKAKSTKEAAMKVLRYTSSLEKKGREKIISKCQKMVLAVGDEEIERIENTYSLIKESFPALKKIGKTEIGRLEPNIVRKRDKGDNIKALYSGTGYMVDFERLSNSFVENTKRTREKQYRVRLSTRVTGVTKSGGIYKVSSTAGEFFARFVVFAAGTYSLYFAKSLGYDKNLSILSIGGGFYYTPRVLRGKVYRVQKGGIPFAAIHGDPDITNPNINRFGPTVTVPLELEKGHIETMPDYIRSFDFDMPTAVSVKRILLNEDVKRILARNAVYGLPFIGKSFFLKNEASVIVPSLKYGDLTLSNDGGIRPQIIDEEKKALVLGEGKINHDEAIFNITPSPGATSCLVGALEDTIRITEHLGREFYEDKYRLELGEVSTGLHYHLR